MYHELFGPRGAEDEREDFWTHIPEGSDMLPGMLPMDDRTEAPGAARARRHSHGDALTPDQIDGLRQALAPDTFPQDGRDDDQAAHTPEGPAI